MNLNHLHDSFFTDISFLILYVYVTFEKNSEKYTVFEKKNFKFRVNFISRIADFGKFRGDLISWI